MAHTAGRDVNVAKVDSRRRGFRSAVAGCVAFLVTIVFGNGWSTRAEPARLVIADVIPVPRPNPVRPSNGPVGTAIKEPTDSSRASASGSDSDSDSEQKTASAVAAPTSAAKIARMATERSMIAEAAFKIAVRLFDQGNPNAALAAGYTLPDPVDSKIIKWLVAVYKYRDVPAVLIDAVSKELSDWPGQRLLRIRFEQALELQKLSPDEVIAAFADNKPVTDDGTLLLVRAYIATGDKARAAALIRPRWREEHLDDGFESTVREEFGELLTKSDQKIRMDRMLYAERTAKALRAAADLGGHQEAVAQAVIEVNERKASAGKTLDDLPKSVQQDPIVVYSRIRFLRRNDDIDAAAKLMLSAPRDPAVLIDADAWWVERRVLAREVILKRDYRTAYRIAAGHSAQSDVSRADAEFHAGWIALEFLNNPESARAHFSVIETISTRPLSQSRANYWLGRAAVAAGNDVEAARQFRRAATYPTTFYGQLALARLDATTLPLAPQPEPDDAARQRFANLELIQVIYRLGEINKDDRKTLFMDHLADTLTNPTDIALLIEMAETDGDYNLSLRLAKTAAYRGIPIDTLVFPTRAIPSSAEVGEVDRALVHAIARQESAFHASAVSPAGARGLLQLMPATAKQMAKRAGVSYSESKLTADPAYNAKLGGHFLDHLLGRYDGSYVMTFAAYNAGPSRVADWIEKNGDPRDPDVDVVNWIELIPFTETRNYVQRIMENLVVYRARFGSATLTIESDLKRGASG